MSTGKLSKCNLTPTADIMEVLDALMPVGGGQTPVVTGYFDGRGRLRRAVAVYPNGWTHRVNLDASGSVTSTSATFKLVAEIRGAE